MVTIQAWFLAEFLYASLWQIYLCHTSHTAAQDLWVSWSTGEVFGQCGFKDLTNNILWSSCDLSSLSEPKYLVYWGRDMCEQSAQGEKTNWEISAEVELKANQESRDRDKSGKSRNVDESPVLNPPSTTAHDEASSKVCLHRSIWRTVVCNPQSCKVHFSVLTHGLFDLSL